MHHTDTGRTGGTVVPLGRPHVQPVSLGFAGGGLARGCFLGGFVLGGQQRSPHVCFVRNSICKGEGTKGSWALTERSMAARAGNVACVRALSVCAQGSEPSLGDRPFS